MATLPMNGQHTLARVLVGGQKFGDDIMISWKAKEVATRFRDDHIGNTFSKTDKQRDGWDLDLTFHHKDLTLIQALEAQEVLRAASQPFQAVSLQITLNERDANVRALLFTNLATEEELDAGSRKERLKFSLTCQAEQRKIIK